MNPFDELNERFGDRMTPERQAEWGDAKSRLTVGGSIRGVVVTRMLFGVFIDVGVGFPALLEVIQLGKTRQEHFKDIEEVPAVGDVVTARVVAFTDRNREIDLTQRDPHPFLDPEQA